MKKYNVWFTLAVHGVFLIIGIVYEMTHYQPDRPWWYAVIYSLWFAALPLLPSIWKVLGGFYAKNMTMEDMMYASVIDQYAPSVGQAIMGASLWMLVIKIGVTILLTLVVGIPIMLFRVGCAIYYLVKKKQT